jgi:hypothetical protein
MPLPGSVTFPVACSNEVMWPQMNTMQCSPGSVSRWIS